MITVNKVAKKRKGLSGNRGFIYILPWLFGFAAFQLYPLLASLFYSFTDYNIVKSPHFVGLKNFIYMFTKDDLFFHSLLVTFEYVAFSVPAKLIFALFIALLLNSRLRFINFFRTVYYMPSVLGGSVAVAIIWRFLFIKEGMINKFLSYLFIPSVDWLGMKMALLTVGLVIVWQFGSSMVLFLAGLKQIPAELYEAGTVDGASKIRMFFVITIPNLTPIILFNLVMQMINAFQDFTAAVVVTNGRPMRATYLFSLKLYEDGFKMFKMGYASALSIVLLTIIVIFTVLIFKVFNKVTYYADGGDF